MSNYLLFRLCSPAPVFYFGEVKYHVDESDGHVEVKVFRTGTDLSKAGTVTVRSRKAEPISAEGEFTVTPPYGSFECIAQIICCFCVLFFPPNIFHTL